MSGGDPARAGNIVPFAPPRARRLRAPLLVLLWWLLGIEALGGLLIFFMRLAAGAMPGETIHVIAGVGLTLAYVVYQVQHWGRVAPWRGRLDYALGLIGAIAMGLTLATGYVLAWPWWRVRILARAHDPIAYSSFVSGAHNIMSMLVLTFVLAHLAAVLLRERAGRR